MPLVFHTGEHTEQQRAVRTYVTSEQLSELQLGQNGYEIIHVNEAWGWEHMAPMFDRMVFMWDNLWILLLTVCHLHLMI